MRLRFAPSPTGYLHVGGARTALFNWLLAKQNKGSFILRIEDTDTERSTQESVDAILQGMDWLGLTYNEGPFYQTDNFELYKKYIQQLLDEGKAYRCYCTPEDLKAKRDIAYAEKRKAKYDGKCNTKIPLNLPGLPYVVRFKSKAIGETSWDDLIKGRISFPNEELDDLIIQRTDGTPTYNFCVVVDDALMNMTTVIRGDDHVNNTPRQIQIYEALGFKVPQFAHVPMILGSDKARLSKRHGATSVMAYKEMGFLPEAMVNYLVRLGWSHGDQEIFSTQEMIDAFDIKHVGKAAGVFNTEKLLWLNQHYIKAADPMKLWFLLKPFMIIRGIETNVSYLDPASVVEILQSRSKTLVEMADQAKPFFKRPKTYDVDALCKIDYKLAQRILPIVIVALSSLDEEEVCTGTLEVLFKELCEMHDFKMKDFGAIMRLSLFGVPNTPGLADVVSILGVEETNRRLEKACLLVFERLG